MATTRIKDVSKTTTDLASDEYIIADGATNGTQKMARDDAYADWAAAFVAAPTTYNIAPLNSGTNKIDATYLPTGADTAKGAWDANANSPALADGAGTAGDYYDVTTAGSSDLGSGSITFTVGDVVKYDGSVWFKIDSVANILDGSSTAAQGRSTLEVLSNDELARDFGTKLVGPAISFDGTNDYIEIADDDKFSFTDGTDDLPFSVGGWVYIPSTTVTSYIIGKWGTGVATQEWLFATSTSGQIRFLVCDGTAVFIAVSDSTISSAGWYHFAATYSGSGPNSGLTFDNAFSGVKLFINGVESTISGSSTGYTGLVNTSQTVRLGAATNLFASLSLKDVKLFNRELSAAEVTTLYNEGQLGFADEWAEGHGDTYTSDFSAGVDGWAAANGTAAGNIDAIGGQDDNLRFTVDTSSGAHYATKNTLLTAGKRYRYSVDFYIPSSQSNIDGISIFCGGSQSVTANDSPTLDSWNNSAGEFIASSTSLRFYPTDGGATTFQDPTGTNVFYIRNVTVTQIGTLLDARAENFNEAGGELIDLSDNAFIGTNNGASLVGGRKHVQASSLDLTGIPTSSAGLSAGEVYSNAGVLTIV